MVFTGTLSKPVHHLLCWGGEKAGVITDTSNIMNDILKNYIKKELVGENKNEVRGQTKAFKGLFSFSKTAAA